MIKTNFILVCLFCLLALMLMRIDASAQQHISYSYNIRTRSTEIVPNPTLPIREKYTRLYFHKPRHLFDDWYQLELEAPDRNSADAAIASLLKENSLQYAEPDAVLELHQETKCPPAEWFVENFGQYGGPDSYDVDTDAWGAWEILRSDSTAYPPIRIAVVDSGINTNHPRFRGVNFYTRQKYVDDLLSIGDVYGHGTAVAGVITAMFTNPAWYELGSYRVFDENGSTNYSNLIRAFEAAVSDNAKVVNFSGGGPYPSGALYASLTSHPEVLFVFSAGNKGGTLPEYPARYHDLSNVVSVAAIEQSGALTSFTSTGALIAAPGQYIFTSLSNCQTQPISLCQPAGYGFVAGTSFSTPMVSAACAGRILRNIGESIQTVREKLLQSVDQKANYRNKLLSAGRLNFQKLLEIP